MTPFDIEDQLMHVLSVPKQFREIPFGTVQKNSVLDCGIQCISLGRTGE